MQGDDLFIGITSLAVLMRGAMYGCEREPRLGIAWIAAQLRLQLRKACRRGTACGLGVPPAAELAAATRDSTLMSVTEAAAAGGWCARARRASSWRPWNSYAWASRVQSASEPPLRVRRASSPLMAESMDWAVVPLAAVPLPADVTAPAGGATDG